MNDEASIRSISLLHDGKRVNVAGRSRRGGDPRKMEREEEMLPHYLFARPPEPVLEKQRLQAKAGKIHCRRSKRVNDESDMDPEATFEDWVYKLQERAQKWEMLCAKETDKRVYFERRFKEERQKHRWLRRQWHGELEVAVRKYRRELYGRMETSIREVRAAALKLLNF